MSDRKALENNIDPGQTKQNTTSDQGLYCLSFIHGKKGHQVLIRSTSMRCDRMTNSVNPGQTVPLVVVCSWSALFAQACLCKLYTFITLWANSAEDNLIVFSLFFPENRF